jgi:hypothetical protein
MSLSDALKDCDLAMGPKDIEAFFIGTLSADDPMKFPKAVRELMLEDTQNPVKCSSPEAREKLDKALAALWKELEKGLEKRRQNLLKNPGGSLKEQAVTLGNLGDFFLMGMTLAGLSVDDQDDELGDLLDEMEDHLLLMDEWVADGESRSDKAVWEEEGTKYIRELGELWDELQEAFTV